jgi:hypothetical protein
VGWGQVYVTRAGRRSSLLLLLMLLLLLLLLLCKSLNDMHF